MKIQFLLASFLFCAASTNFAGDYVISIDGRSAEIDLNKKYKLKTASGEEFTVLLKQREYLTYKSDLFSMKHKNTLKPNKTDLGDGVFQTLMSTPLGTVIIIQEYLDMNPQPMIDLLLKEITKEEIDYGYKYKEKKIDKLVGGKKFSGKQALTSYPGTEWTRSIMVYGGKDKGVLVITMIEKDQYNSEKYLISDLWKSFRIAFD